MKIKLIACSIIILTALVAILYDIKSQPEIIKAPQKISKKSLLKKLPIFEFQDINGNIHNIANIKNDIILINFWATWCKPCIVELPDMIELVNNSNGKIALITISIDNKKENIIKFHEKLKNLTDKNIYHKDIYWNLDENKNISYKIFNTKRVPETIIINKERMMVDKILGITDWKKINFLNL